MGVRQQLGRHRVSFAADVAAAEEDDGVLDLPREEAFSSGDPAARAAAWRRLGLVAAAGEGADVAARAAAAAEPRAVAALADPDAEVRSAACRALRKVAKAAGEGPAPAARLVAALVACLSDPQEQVQVAAALALPALGDEGAAPAAAAAAVAEQLRRHRDGGSLAHSGGGGEKGLLNRVQALRALGRMRRAAQPCVPEVARLLLPEGARPAAAEDDSEQEVREEAAAALEAISPLDGLDTLLKALRNDPSALVRMASATALWAAARRQSKKAAGPPEAADRPEAVDAGPEAAGEEGAPQQWPPGRLADLVAACAAAAQVDEDWGVRREALKALGACGPEGRAHAAAIVASLRDADPDVRHAAAEALGELSGTEPAGSGFCAAHAGALGALLGDGGAVDGDARVRAAAARTLGRMRSKPHVPVLEAALADAEAEVRRWAAWALSFAAPRASAEVQGRAAQRVAKLIRGDRDPAVRKAAVVAMLKFKAHAVEVRQALEEDSDSGVRAAAVDSFLLVCAPGETRTSVLVAAVGDASRRVQAAAVRALGSIGADAGPKGAAALAAVLSGSSGLGLQAAAIKALAATGKHAHEHAPALAQVLAGVASRTPTVAKPSPDKLARRAAADALGEMGKAGAREARALALALQADASETVRYCAAWSLGEVAVHGERLGAEEVAAAAGAVRGDADTDVREAAAQALGALAASLAGGKPGPAAAARAALLDALADAEASVRAAAARALGVAHTQDPAVLERLQCLREEEEDEDVLAAVDEALGELESP